MLYEVITNNMFIFSSLCWYESTGVRLRYNELHATLIIQTLIGAHYLPDTRILNQGLKGREIGFV